MRSVIRSWPRNLNSSADRLIAVSLPLGSSQNSDAVAIDRRLARHYPVLFGISSGTLSEPLEGATRTGRAAYSRGAVPVLSSTNPARYNLKLVASLLHMLVCGYDRLPCRDPGDRLYSVWYPPSPAESSNNSTTECRD